MVALTAIDILTQNQNDVSSILFHDGDNENDNTKWNSSCKQILRSVPISKRISIPVPEFVCMATLTAIDIQTQTYNTPSSILFHNGNNGNDTLPIFYLALLMQTHSKKII